MCLIRRNSPIIPVIDQELMEQAKLLLLVSKLVFEFTHKPNGIVHSGHRLLRPTNRTSIATFKTSFVSTASCTQKQIRIYTISNTLNINNGMYVYIAS